MYEIDFKEIRTWLEPRHIVQLAGEEGVTSRAIYQRLSERTKRVNVAFIERASKLALENKTRAMASLNKMKSLTA